MSKQDTITTLTIEAELLALLQIAKKALYLTRLLNKPNVTLLNLKIIINYNNKQTIRLITKDITKLRTKL